MSTRYSEIRNLRILKQIAETLNRGVSKRQTLDSTLPLVIELLGLHTGWLFLQDDSGGFAVATTHNLPPALPYPDDSWCEGCTCQSRARRGELGDAACVVECSRLGSAEGDRQGLAYHASVPLIKGDRLLGIMNVATPQWDMFTPEDLQILTAIGYQFATAIERTLLAEQATRVALVEERNRLAREVHDTLAQELAGIALQLEAADALLDSTPERARARIRQALATTRESLAEARRSVLDLRSGPLERQELPSALLELARRFQEESGVPVAADLAWDGPRLPARHEQALYRIAQEALANVRQHAGAQTVALVLRMGEGRVTLRISDDGHGFDSAGTDGLAVAPDGRARYGLISMRERALLLGGQMRIASSPDAGTCVEVELPLEA
ncbi:MAG: sensor histidine kinase [Roseiflexaceae bacterium]